MRRSRRSRADLPVTGADPERLAALDERWGLGSSLRRAASVLAGD